MKNGGTHFFPTKLGRLTFVLWGTSSSSCRWWNPFDSVSTLMATPSLPSPDDEPDTSNHKRNQTQKHTHTLTRKSCHKALQASKHSKIYHTGLHSTGQYCLQPSKQINVVVIKVSNYMTMHYLCVRV